MIPLGSRRVFGDITNQGNKSNNISQQNLKNGGKQKSNLIHNDFSNGNSDDLQKKKTTKEKPMPSSVKSSSSSVTSTSKASFNEDVEYMHGSLKLAPFDGGIDIKSMNKISALPKIQHDHLEFDLDLIHNSSSNNKEQLKLDDIDVSDICIPDFSLDD